MVRPTAALLMNKLHSNFLPTRPRILFHISDFGRGGTETALIAWLHALSKAHFKVEVCVSFPTGDLECWRDALPAGVPVHLLASKPWMHELHEIRRQHKLTPHMKVVKNVLTYGVLRPLFHRKIKALARNFDVICDFDMSLRSIAGKYDVLWLGVNHYSIATRFGGLGRKRIERRCAQLVRYDAIAVQTSEMLREGMQVFPGLANKLTELPNIIDGDALMRRALEPAQIPTSPYIVSVARLDESQKDHRTLLRAYAKLRRSGITSCDLCIVGEGSFRGELEALAHELGIDSTVHFVGFQSNPHPFIKGAKALVLSSRYEGFGMVLGEAMALRVPVISTDCPTGPRDLLDDGRAGLLVPVGDALAMSAAIRKILTDAPLRTRLVEHAFDRVKLYNPVGAAERLMALVG